MANLCNAVPMAYFTDWTDQLHYCTIIITLNEEKYLIFYNFRIIFWFIAQKSLDAHKWQIIANRVYVASRDVNSITELYYTFDWATNYWSVSSTISLSAFSVMLIELY